MQFLHVMVVVEKTKKLQHNSLSIRTVHPFFPIGGWSSLPARYSLFPLLPDLFPVLPDQSGDVQMAEMFCPVESGGLPGLVFQPQVRVSRERQQG